MMYYLENVYSVRVNYKDWTKQYPDVTFVDVDCEYVNDEDKIVRKVLTMDIEDWWIIEEYGYFAD